MKSKRAYFVRIASRPIPRVTRMMEVFSAFGYDSTYIGSFRERNLPKEDTWEDWAIVRVGPYFPLLNGRRPALYVKSVVAFGMALLAHLRRTRPSVVHASDLEAAIPSLIIGRLQGIPVVYNIHDNLAQRYDLPYFVRKILNGIEGVVSRASTVTVVPEEFRRDALPRWARPTVKVIRNTPIDPGFSPYHGMAEHSPFQLLYAGWLDWGRGVSELIDLIDSESRLSLLVAGEGDDEVESSVRSHERVEFRGYLSHADIINLTRQSGFVVALYDPARPINRFAASNKVAEGLAVGRPIILNSELEIADSLRTYGCLVEQPYDEIASLGPRLREIAGDPDRYEEMCRAARRAYEELYDWNTERTRIEEVVRIVESRVQGG